MKIKKACNKQLMLKAEKKITIKRCLKINNKKTPYIRITRTYLKTDQRKIKIKFNNHKIIKTVN